MTVDFANLESRPGDGSHLKGWQIQYIQAYMREVLVRLELNYWHVWVAKDLAPEGCLMMIQPTDGRRIAMLYTSEDWWTESPDHRLDIVHEALHLAHHDQEEVIRRFKRDQGDIGAYPMDLVWSQFKVETERMVDGLSYVLAPLMPKWNPPTVEEKQTLSPITLNAVERGLVGALTDSGVLTVRTDKPDGVAHSE